MSALPFERFYQYKDPAENAILVHVREGAHDVYLLDMTPETATYDDAALTVGQSYTDPNGLMTVHFESTSSSGALVSFSFPHGSTGAPTGTCLGQPIPDAGVEDGSLDADDSGLADSGNTDAPDAELLDSGASDASSAGARADAAVDSGGSSGETGAQPSGSDSGSPTTEPIPDASRAGAAQRGPLSRGRDLRAAGGCSCASVTQRAQHSASDAFAIAFAIGLLGRRRSRRSRSNAAVRRIE